MNKKTRKLFTWCLVVCMVVVQMLFANVAFAATNKEAGTDRYQTALKVVQAGWTKSDNAVIARGDDLADALAAAPLAYAKDKAPILLTETGALPTGVMEELTALGVKNVYIVGGTGAVSQAVETALAAKFTVTRLFGADRYATSLAVAKAAFPTAPAKAVMVNGEAYADALSVSSIAAYNGMPILLVGKDSMSADVAAYLTGKTVYAIGGTGVISDTVAANATRLWGADRYATNVAVLKAFTLDYANVFVAVGEDANAVDALGGAAFAALGNNPIFLVNGALTTAASDLLKANLKATSNIYVLGGVVPASVASAIEDLINGLELGVKSVTVTNAKDITVLFNRAADDITAEDPANYTIKVNNQDALDSAADYTVAQDSKDASKVVITLADPIKNGDVVKVTVSQDILDENLKGMSDDYTVTLPAFSDKVAPSITKVAVDGSDVVVTFDDYIETSATTLAKVDGVSYDVTVDGKTLTLTDANDPELAEGNHTVAVYNIADLLGNTASGLTKTLTISADSTEPSVESVKAKSTYIFEVTFNKELATAPTVEVTKGGHTVGVASVDAGDDNSVWDVTLNEAAVDPDEVSLYATGEKSVTISATISDIKDSNDTYGAPVTKTVTMTKDTVAPTVDLRNVKVTGDVITVQFSEELDAVTGVAASKVIVTDKDGVRLDPTTLSFDIVDDARFGDGTVLEITSSDALADGKYTVVLSSGAVLDLAGNKNVAATVTATKSTATDEEFALGGADATDNVITVDFDGHTMTSSAVNVNNYLLDNAKLPAGTVAYFLGDKSTVKIELPAESVKTSDKYVLTLSKSIVDEDGLTVDDDTNNQVVDLVDNVKPVLVSAKKVDSTTINLTFSEAMADPTGTDDFAVTVNGAKLTVDSAALDPDDAKVIVLTVAGYNTNQTVVVKVGAGTDDEITVTDVEGNLLTDGTSVTATK